MITPRKILAIGAHPDDIEYGCGGTLLRCGQSGVEIYLMVMTDGSMGGDAGVRKAEQLESARFIGARDVIFGEVKDTELAVSSRTIALVDKQIKLIKPDMIFVNYYNDSHQDHRACAEIVMASARQIDSVLYYEDYTSLQFEPCLFTDISEVLVRKEELISLHRTQIQQAFYPSLYDLKESIKAIAIFRGFQARKKFAEGFLPLRLALNC